MKIQGSHLNTSIRWIKRFPRLSRVLFTIAIDATFAIATIAAQAAAGIVPDGSTTTGVTTSSAGCRTVTLAPAIDGVSNNTYTSFNVSIPFNLVVSARNQVITQPLWDAINLAGGKVYKFDPTTQSIAQITTRPH